MSVTQRKGRPREGWEVAVLAGGWMEGGAYPNDSKKARSSEYYSFSLSGLRSSLLTVIAGVSKVFREQSNWWATGSKVLLMSFPPAVLCQNYVITIFPPVRFFHKHYSLRIVSHVSSLFIYSICVLYLLYSNIQ